MATRNSTADLKRSNTLKCRADEYHRENPQWTVCGETATARLKHGLCVIDMEDLPKVIDIRWHSVNNRGIYYAVTSRRRGGTFLHNVVLPPPEDKKVDHKDGNGLNNRRSNLRHATSAQNQQNKRKQVNCKRSRFKGVRPPSGPPSRGRSKWGVELTCRGKRYYRHGFNSEEEAARGYDRLAKELFGEFARLNFPEAQ